MEEQIEFKYICKDCDFKCNDLSRWNKHVQTQKHITGKRKLRSDFAGPYKCDKCNYETKNSTTFKQHKLNDHSSKEERESGFKFYCKLCDFGTFSKGLYDNHKISDKHIKHEKNYK